MGAIEELILDGTLHSFLKAQEKDPELSKVTEAMTKWDHHFTKYSARPEKEISSGWVTLPQI